MKFDRTLIAVLLIWILAFAPSACGITISVGGDAGGFTENINVGDKDVVYSSTMIAANSLSHSIKGSGSLKESHWVSNSAGASAGVGVEIRKAKSYSYDYYLTPGPGFFWPASRYPVVSAGETLDVTNAYYINAYANSFNAKGESAGVSTVLVDPGRKASLAGYSNTAAVTPDKVVAIQNAVSASAPGGSIQTKADSQLRVACHNCCKFAVAPCPDYTHSSKDKYLLPVIQSSLISIIISREEITCCYLS